MIIACYHYSNFEWLSLACGFLELKGTIISQEFKNSLLDPIFKNLREQSGHQLIARARDCPALQGAPAKRAHRIARRSNRATQSGRGGD